MRKYKWGFISGCSLIIELPVKRGQTGYLCDVLPLAHKRLLASDGLLKTMPVKDTQQCSMVTTILMECFHSTPFVSD